MMNKFKSILLVAIFIISVLTASGFAQAATKWNVDMAHSQIRFSVNHFFTPVYGKFDKFNIDLRFDPENLKESSIDVSIDVNSVNTGNEKRDRHLPTPDFFDAAQFPLITFRSSEIVSTGENTFLAKGKLTMKDVSKEIELPFTLLGVKEFPQDNQKPTGGVKKVAGFKANYMLNRMDYHVGTGKWAKTLMVGGKIGIEIELEVNIRY